MVDQTNMRRSWQSEADGVDSKNDPLPLEERFYEIRVKGHIDSRWSEWLGGLEVLHLEDGETILWGSIIDQAALMGILNKLGRLNLELRSVNEVQKRSEQEKE